MKTFAIKTLGCKVNQYEEQVIRESLIGQGYSEVETSRADVFIVNSCTVTEQADIKTRRLMRSVKKENPGVKVVITGCYAIMPDDIKKLKAMPEVDMLVPGSEKEKLPHLLDPAISIVESLKEEVLEISSHTRTFLKIQDGCDQSCSYCKVSVVRGPSRSKDKKDVLKEVERMSEKSKEIVLTGICLGSWKGSEKETLADLLNEISRMDGEFRIRLSSIELNHITDDIIDAIVSNPRICRHLHIPLQSGSDKVLREMNRRYNARDFETRIADLCKRMPLIGITMDVITGFPGETDKDFDLTAGFIKKIRPSRLHVFTYSDREGTQAFDMSGKIPGDVSKKRTKTLIEIGQQLQLDFCMEFKKKKVEILVEKISSSGLVEGYTDEYLRTKAFSGNKHIKKGDIITLDVVDIDPSIPCLVGRI